MLRFAILPSMRQTRAFLLSLLTAASATAQTDFTFGVQVGPAYTTAETSYSLVGTDVDLEGQVGFVALGVVEWSATDRLGLVVEAGYARRGVTELGGNTVSGRERRETQFDVATAAVLLKGRVPGRRASVYAVAGPTLGVPLGVSYNDPFSDFSEDPASFTVGGAIGLGVEILLPSAARAVVEVRAAADATSAFDGDRPAVDRRDVYHRGVEARIGVLF